MSEALRIEIESGVVEGSSAHERGVDTFLGIPYAAPPTGPLRWRPPQPVAGWKSVRPASGFGPRCPQNAIFADMVFRDEVAEDCLYLNVWRPSGSTEARLPVMVWIHGGGFVAGSASEPRQDGSRLALEGVVVVGVNYRLGVLGFFSHPELTAESEHGASGNQGLLDQAAALEWVRRNIELFGGDPQNVTIFGESAGSSSVSALMAAPPAQGLFHKAIGQSGALFPSARQPLATKALGKKALGKKSLAKSEATGVEFGETVGAASLEALRALPVADLLKAALEGRLPFSPSIDGTMLARPVSETFEAGEQSAVPLLAGWNADELRAMVTVLQRPSAEDFIAQTHKRFGDAADRILSVYPARNDAEAIESAAALAGDLFIGHATCSWLETHARTGSSAVYRYSFDRKIPVPAEGWNGRAATAADIGAFHSGEIEYVFGALDSKSNVPWETEDRELSRRMRCYWSNFARAGDPNSDALPHWPIFDPDATAQVMHLDTRCQARPDDKRPRYDVLDGLA